MTSPLNARFPGLTPAEVLASRAAAGGNVLTPPPRESAWRLWLAKFEDPVIRILVVAAVLQVGVGAYKGEYVEGLAIVLAILLATTIAFLNEYKAGREFDVLNQRQRRRAGQGRPRPGRSSPCRSATWSSATSCWSRPAKNCRPTRHGAGRRRPERVRGVADRRGRCRSPSTRRGTRPNPRTANTRVPGVTAVLRGTTVADGYGVARLTAVGDAHRDSASSAGGPPRRPARRRRSTTSSTGWPSGIGDRRAGRSRRRRSSRSSPAGRRVGDLVLSPGASGRSPASCSPGWRSPYTGSG